MKKKKVIAIIMSLMLLFVFPIQANATMVAEQTINPRYQNMTSCVAAIKNNNGTLTATGTVSTNKTCVVKIKLTVQWSTSSSNTGSWYDYKTFSTKTLYSGNPRVASEPVDSVISNRWYRTVAEIEVIANGISEKTTAISDPVRIN